MDSFSANGNTTGSSYNTTLRALIPLPDPNAPVGSITHPSSYEEFAKGSVVMAQYPDTTTFYKAEVVQTPREAQTASGKVSPLLRFEGLSQERWNYFRPAYRKVSQYIASNLKMTTARFAWLPPTLSLNGREMHSRLLSSLHSFGIRNTCTLKLLSLYLILIISYAFAARLTFPSVCSVPRPACHFSLLYSDVISERLKRMKSPAHGHVLDSQIFYAPFEPLPSRAGGHKVRAWVIQHCLLYYIALVIKRSEDHRVTRSREIDEGPPNEFRLFTRWGPA